ncbi:MAG: hypothetical protein U0470_04710 [Anaerolineae bacterium]
MCVPPPKAAGTAVWASSYDTVPLNGVPEPMLPTLVPLFTLIVDEVVPAN